MYRHLLVPIDDSALSVETTRQAVTFAAAIGAKITFFHAKADYGASSLGALERVMSPGAFNDQLAGEARALLAKAEVVARALGVSYDSIYVTSDRPYAAILDAADARGCDLVFMASHGERGIRNLLLGSQTQRVLQHTTIPVLVSTVEGNAATASHTAPVAMIRDEHRSLGAVIHGFEYLVRTAREGGAAPDFRLVRAMLYYIEAFSEKLHHPKENAYLFRRLRERTPAYNDTLDELEAQHAAGAQVVTELKAAIDRYEADPAGGFDAFSAAVNRFATTQWEHMALETKVIIPAALEHLTDDDWNAIRQAFAENGDPRFTIDADEEFRSLFARILNLAPEHVVGSATH